MARLPPVTHWKASWRLLLVSYFRQKTNEAAPQTDKHGVSSQVGLACLTGRVLHHLQERPPRKASANRKGTVQTPPQTVAEVLSKQVVLEVESIDRII